MQLARICGKTTATVKHPSFEGQKLLICQPLGANKQPEGDPFIAIDRMGATQGDLVYISSASNGIQKLVNNTNTPIRWFVLGIADPGEIK